MIPWSHESRVAIWHWKRTTQLRLLRLLRHQVLALPLQGGRRAPSGSLSIALEVPDSYSQKCKPSARNGHSQGGSRRFKEVQRGLEASICLTSTTTPLGRVGSGCRSFSASSPQEEQRAISEHPCDCIIFAKNSWLWVKNLGPLRNSTFWCFLVWKDVVLIQGWEESEYCRWDWSNDGLPCWPGHPYPAMSRYPRGICQNQRDNHPRHRCDSKWWTFKIIQNPMDPMGLGNAILIPSSNLT